MELAIPLLGRDCPAGPDGNRVRFFGGAFWDPTAPTDAGNVPPSTWTDRAVQWSGKGCGLWRLTTYGLTAIGGSELDVPSERQILGQQPLPTGWIVRRKCVPIWVKLIIGPFNNEYYLDPNGTIEFWADDGVDVAWAAPPLWVDLDKQAAPVVSGMLSYAGLLYAELRRIEAAVGPRRRMLTQHFTVPANTAQTSDVGWLAVPMGATRVQISQDGAGALTGGTWSMLYAADPAVTASQVLGVVPIVSRITAGAVELAANVTHLAAPNVAENRVWTVVWEIEP